MPEYNPYGADANPGKIMLPGTKKKLIEQATSINVADIDALANKRIATIQADAQRYGYSISKEVAYRQALAQEYSALMNKQGIVGAAERNAMAQMYTAEMQKSGLITSTQRSAIAQEFTARENRIATVHAARLGKEGQVLSAKEYAAAQKYGSYVTANAQMYTAKQSARAQIVSTERASRAEEYKSRQQLKGTIRASEAQEKSAGMQMSAQIGSATSHSASNVVTSGFGAFNASQRLGRSWTFRDSSPAGARNRALTAAGIFVFGMLILFVAMDLFGFPILQGLTDMITNATARAVALVDAVKGLASNDNVQGIQDLLASTGSTIAGGIGGMMAAFVDSIAEFFSNIGEWFSNTWNKLTEGISDYFD